MTGYQRKWIRHIEGRGGVVLDLRYGKHLVIKVRTPKGRVFSTPVLREGNCPRAEKNFIAQLNKRFD